MKKYIFLVSLFSILLINPDQIFSQKNINIEQTGTNVDSIATPYKKSIFFKFGIGASQLRISKPIPKDSNVIYISNEIEYRFIPYLSCATGISYAKNSSGTRSLIQGNLNIIISPFGNTKTNIFNVSGGLLYTNISY